MPVEVGQTKDIAACQDVRRKVFIEEQGVSPAEEVDGHDPEALHILATEGGQPIGTARMLHLGEVIKIGRVCVLPSHRGTGLGARIMGACLEVACRQNGARRARLGAQVDAIGFYEKLGFEICGPHYLDAGIEHRDMELPL